MTIAHHKNVTAHTAGGTMLLKNVNRPKIPAAPSTRPDTSAYPTPALAFFRPACPSHTVFGTTPPQIAESIVQIPSANCVSLTL